MYDPIVNQWIQKADVPGEDKRAGFAFALETTGYVGGGFYNGYNFWEYNSITDQWTQKNDHPDLGYATAPNYRTDDVTFTINGEGYVTGTNMYTWKYSPANDTWTQLDYVDTSYCGAFSINNKGYIFNTHGDLFALETVTEQWIEQPAYPGQLMCDPVAFSINGNGYVGLGGIFKNNTCTLEVSSEFWQFSPEK